MGALGCLSGTTPYERKTFERSTRVSNENSRSGSQEAIESEASEALFMLAQTPLIDLLVQKRSAIDRGNDSSRENIHNIMLDRWQNRWSSNTGRAACTKILIRDLRPWADRKHGQVSYFLTQFLTGQGSHQAYLRRFGISEIDECTYCDGIDTVEYTFFACPTWPQRDSKQKGL
ncbi:hypothetical protein Trydic_g22944 [Trypoxylus dichotomus]